MPVGGIHCANHTNFRKDVTHTHQNFCDELPSSVGTSLSGYTFLCIFLRSSSAIQTIVNSLGCLSSSDDALKTSTSFLETLQFYFFWCYSNLRIEDNGEVEACRLYDFTDCFDEALALMTDGGIITNLCFQLAEGG